MIDAIMGRNHAVRHLQSRAARFLFGAGLTPNRATAAGLFMGVGAGIAFGLDSRAIGIVLLGFSAILDAVDGTIAREQANPTVLGGIFDLCSDRVVEIAVIIGIAWQRPEIYLPAMVLIATWYLNITVFLATGVALERGDKVIAYPPGIVERTEAIIFFVVLALARPIGPILCYAYAALEIVTAVQRIIFAKSMLSAR